MSEWHIPEELLERFLRLEASRQESMQVVRHLLSGCPQCLELAHRAALESGLFTPLEAGQKAGWEQAYAEVFSRALTFATEEERKLAESDKATALSKAEQYAQQHTDQYSH